MKEEDVIHLLKTLGISFLLTLILGTILYFLWYRDIQFNKWLYLSLFIVLLTIIWAIVHVLILKFKWGKLAEWQLLTFLVSMIVLSILVQDVYLKSRIEQENTSIYEDIGFLYSDDPILSNGTYTRTMNFSLHNSLKGDIDIIEFDVKFKEGNYSYTLIGYYPDYGVVNNETCFNEIYFRWEHLKSGDTAFLLFSVSWDEQDGDNEYIPIDLSSEGTYVRLGNTLYWKYVTYL